MPELSVLISQEDVQNRVHELASQLDIDYMGKDLILLGVLKGSVHFLSDLSRAMKSDTTIDFIQASSYGNGQSSSGVVQIRKDHDVNIEGRHVLIVEDIIDSGLTVKHLKELLSARKPASIKCISLLSKPDARLHDVRPDYLGFDIPDSFVVGYGLDSAEKYRSLPFIAELTV
jgi:hypoxanthine phosphoribosyltransferase